MRADVSAFKILNIFFFIIAAMMVLCSCSDDHSSWKSDYQELVDAWETQKGEDVELKDVKFVGGNVVRYQREQTKLRWKKLEEVLTEDDILGNKSVEYFLEKWEGIMNKYSK